MNKICTAKSSSIQIFEKYPDLDPQRIPKHVAIIPDGNRRWAKLRNQPEYVGHRMGADTLMDMVRFAQEVGIEVVTFYIFSTENWQRSKKEIDHFMSLLATYLLEQREEMIQSGIRLHTIGQTARLPLFLLEVIEGNKQATCTCDKIQLVLAIDYGGRDEICRAFQRILKDYQQGVLNEQKISEELLTTYLDTSQFKDPDLLIRTSGELRISNFLLWQLSYAEIHTTPVLWPDFTPEDFVLALTQFQHRQRRRGGT